MARMEMAGRVKGRRVRLAAAVQRVQRLGRYRGGGRVLGGSGAVVVAAAAHFRDHGVVVGRGRSIPEAERQSEVFRIVSAADAAPSLGRGAPSWYLEPHVAPSRARGAGTGPQLGGTHLDTCFGQQTGRQFGVERAGHRQDR